MAIGSEPPIGERFGKIAIDPKTGMLDQEAMSEAFQKFREQTKNGILAGYARVCYPTPEGRERMAKKIRDEYCIHGTGCCSEH